MQKKLVSAVLFLALLWPVIASAQTEDKLQFNRHGYVPIISFGSSENKDPGDRSLIFQWLGGGYTFLKFKKIRTLGIEANILTKSYINSREPDIERDAHVGIGILTPLSYSFLSSESDSVEISFRIGVGYGFFPDHKPVKVVIFGITIGS